MSWNSSPASHLTAHFFFHHQGSRWTITDARVVRWLLLYCHFRRIPSTIPHPTAQHPTSSDRKFGVDTTAHTSSSTVVDRAQLVLEAEWADGWWRTFDSYGAFDISNARCNFKHEFRGSRWRWTAKEKETKDTTYAYREHRLAGAGRGIDVCDEH